MTTTISGSSVITPAIDLTTPLAVEGGGTGSSVFETPVKTALNASGSAPMFACRAWVNFNGTGTVAIRASGNVSSITDNGVGVYTVNFTTAIVDANYAVALASRPAIEANESAQIRNGSILSTTAVSILCHRPGVGNVDSDYVNVSIFR